MSPTRRRSSSFLRNRSSAALPHLGALAALGLAACQLLNDKPAEAPAPKPEPSAATPSEPAPLPPEETPPPEEPARLVEPPNATPVEPGITATGAPTRGTLPKAAIDEKLKAAAPEIQSCYERGLKAKPGLRGNVNINFVVATDGKVVHADASAGDDVLDDNATIDCILVAIRKLEFPQPKGGRVFINYPLKLEPAKP
jgi:outer membrane biosynthesis protein TonB